MQDRHLSENPKKWTVNHNEQWTMFLWNMFPISCLHMCISLAYFIVFIALHVKGRNAIPSLRNKWNKEEEYAIQSQPTHGNPSPTRQGQRWFAIAFFRILTPVFLGSLPYKYWPWPALLSSQAPMRSGEIFLFWLPEVLLKGAWQNRMQTSHTCCQHLVFSPRKALQI